MRTLRDEALMRLQTRAARLVRLLSLEAPTQIIVNEAALCADAAKVLDPDAWYAWEARRWMTVAKPAMGFCAEGDCQERVAEGYDVCEAHIQEEDVPEPEDRRVELEALLADPDLPGSERERLLVELSELDEN